VIGRPRVHLRATDSTNERAKALAGAGAVHGTLVTAREQSAGRGRQGRSWTAEPGSAVLMSLVLRDLSEHYALLPLGAAVAVCEAAEACVQVRCRIKWPNDVWIEGRKVAGILVEGRVQEGWAVLGIGLNVRKVDFPPELSGMATTLGIEDTEGVLTEILGALSRRLADPQAEVLAAWRVRDALAGQHVRWDGGEGTAAGIDDAGSLLVDTRDGRVALAAGEVHLAPLNRG